jgi:hypothetical protein
MLHAALAPSRTPTENRRYSSRRSLHLNAVLTDTGTEMIIHDISATGMLIETAQHLSAGQIIVFDLPERGQTAATVTWSSGHYFGCQFELSITSATVSAALLRSQPGVTPVGRESGWEAEVLSNLLAKSAHEGLSADGDLEIVDDRYSLRTRFLLIVGISVAGWGLIIRLVTTAFA